MGPPAGLQRSARRLNRGDTLTVVTMILTPHARAALGALDAPPRPPVAPESSRGASTRPPPGRSAPRGPRGLCVRSGSAPLRRPRVRGQADDNASHRRTPLPLRTRPSTPSCAQKHPHTAPSATRSRSLPLAHAQDSLRVTGPGTPSACGGGIGRAARGCRTRLCARPGHSFPATPPRRGRTLTLSDLRVCEHVARRSGREARI